MIIKKLKFFLPKFLFYHLVRYKIYLGYLNYSIYFLKSLFYKKKIEKINQDLILIGQIQRSGGTLLTQLFDNHPEIHSYPSELILTQPKWDWTKNLEFSTIKFNVSLKLDSLKKYYIKKGQSRPDKTTKNIFLFNPYIEKKIFKSLNKNNLRSNFDAYFTSFFNAFINYKNNKSSNKKFITAFLPRFLMSNKNIDLFFKIYPNGKLISIIRDPKSWLMSAKKHSKSYEDTKVSLELWKNCCENSLQIKKSYPEKLILIKFEDLIIDTRNTMKKICQKININFDECLLIPTFNNELINSDSSFKSVSGKIDKSVLEIKDKNIYLSNNDEKILDYYVSWYENFISGINQ